MSAPGPVPAWMTASLALGDACSALAGAIGQLGAPPPSPEAWAAALAEPYRRLLAPFTQSPAMEPGLAGTARRHREAAERYAAIVSRIATDAGRRLAAALASTDPEAPPITTLRELFALWIDCGETAWSEAAHREDFAAAQAELLAALVELGAPGSSR